MAQWQGYERRHGPDRRSNNDRRSSEPGWDAWRQAVHEWGLPYHRRAKIDRRRGADRRQSSTDQHPLVVPDEQNDTQRRETVSHIVVVDDDPGLLEMLHDVLEEEGLAVVSLTRPDLHRVIAASPDVVLIDVLLPEMNGIELAQRLRGASIGDIPFIAMSSSKEMVRRAAQSGMFQDTITKPFELSTLLSCLECHL